MMIMCLAAVSEAMSAKRQSEFDVTAKSDSDDQDHAMD